MGFVLLALLVGLPLLMIGISAIWDLRHRRATGRSVTVTRRSRRAGFTITPLKTSIMNDATRSGANRQNYGDLGKR